MYLGMLISLNVTLHKHVKTIHTLRDHTVGIYLHKLVSVTVYDSLYSLINHRMLVHIYRHTMLWEKTVGLIV